MVQESRLIEEELAAAKQVETEDRVAAAVLSTGYIVDLLPSVVQGLKDAGYLYEEIKDGTYILLFIGPVLPAVSNSDISQHPSHTH